MDNLQFCSVCENKKFDRNRGIVCGITNEKPDFVNECPDYIANEDAKTKLTNHISKIKPNAKRADIAQLLLWIIIGLDFIGIISSYLQYNLLSEALNGVYITDSEAEINDMREILVGLTQTLANIICIITFIMWFRRGYFNLNERTSCDKAEGWAAGAWFVPIISLFYPYQIMKEMWIKTTNMLKAKLPEFKTQTKTTIIGVWWTIWIISNYIGNYTFRVIIKADTIEGLMDSSMADIIQSLINIPLAYLAIKMIKTYNVKEVALAKAEEEQLLKL